MNDDFLSQFRRDPRPEFSQSLYARLTQAAKSRPSISRYAVVKRIALGLAALCLLVFVLYAAAPAAARAVLDDFIAMITVKGTTIRVYADLPTPSAEWDRNEEYGAVWRPVDPQEISANHPFFAPLPAWVPADFKLQDAAALYFVTTYAKTPSSAVFEWKDSHGQMIQLQVDKGSCPNGLLLDPNGTSQEMRSDCTLASFTSLGLESEPQVVAVNGQPGVIYRGVVGLADLSSDVKMWNPSRWMSSLDVTRGATMVWESDGRTFRLIALSASIGKDEMLRMAESIP